jgi:hypothetical protein
VKFKQLLLGGVALSPAALFAIEGLDHTALLQCHVQSTTCEAMDVQPPVHHADAPERELQALHEPEQLVEAPSTKPIAYDLGIPSERSARPWPSHVMGRASDDGWLGTVV